MLRSLRRIATAVLLALPGIGLAFLTKPLILGEGILCVGVLLAFLVPVWWRVSQRPPQPSGTPRAAASGRAEPVVAADRGPRR